MQTGCEMLSQPEENNCRDRAAENRWPTSTALQQLHQPTAFVLVGQLLQPQGEEVMAWRCLAWRAMHHHPATLTQSVRYPQTALQIQKVCTTMVWPKLSLQYFGLLVGSVERYLTLVGLQRKIWGTMLLGSLAVWGHWPSCWRFTQERFFCFYLQLFWVFCFTAYPHEGQWQ